MIRVSITLPSIYPDAAARALRNIRDATRGTYEVILVSPFKPPVEHKHIVWIEEKSADAKGCAAAHAKAGVRASGEFLTPFSDDHWYVDGWDVMAVRNFERCEAAFHYRAPNMPPFSLGLMHVSPRHVGTLFGIYYPYFPFMRRTVAQTIGWYDPSYRLGFSDGDLGLRVWSRGGRCEWSDRPLLCVAPDDARKTGPMYSEDDLKLCVKRWAPRYGKGWDTTHIRGFNVDKLPVGVGNTFAPT